MVGELTLPGGGFTHSRAGPPAGTGWPAPVGKHVVLGISTEPFHLKPVEGTAIRHRGASETWSSRWVRHDVYMNTKLHDHVVGRVEARQD
jgi:hypothetical protein